LVNILKEVGLGCLRCQRTGKILQIIFNLLTKNKLNKGYNLIMVKFTFYIILL